MKLETYIGLVLKAAAPYVYEGTVTFSVRVNEVGRVSEVSPNVITFTVDIVQAKRQS